MSSNESSGAASTSSGGGCPVMVMKDGGEYGSQSSKSGSWNRWFSSSDDSNSTELSACPAKGEAEKVPASIEEASKYSHSPATGQRIPLSTYRVISSIPRGDEENDAVLSSTTTKNNNKTVPPVHQPPDRSNWQYPSEQQFYNSMLRKGHRPPIKSIPSVLQIHNAVNERSWSQVTKWEKELHNNEHPKLAKFLGRPKDLSPRAWFNINVLMTQAPFDRHDWYVEDNEGGEPRRYVIDFYEGKEKKGDLASAIHGVEGGVLNAPMKPPSMYIDARPALDNPSAAVDRMTMFMREALPGLTALYDSYQSSPPTSNVAPVAATKDVGSEKYRVD